MTLGRQTEDSPSVGVSKAHWSRKTSNLFLITFFTLSFALKFLKSLKNTQQEEGGLELKLLEDSEFLKWDGKCFSEVHRGMEESGVFKPDI